MKTILLIIGGMNEVTAPGNRASIEAAVPSLQALATDARTGFYLPTASPIDLNESNALLSLFGYDLRKGEISAKNLEELGNGKINLAESNLPTFTIPGFSGFGSMVSPVAAARAVGMMAALEAPLIPTDPNDAEATAEALVNITLNRIRTDEFVAVYVNWPAIAAFAGDKDAKREIIKLIDYDIVSPIADYVWRADEVMNLAVTSGYATSWRKQQYEFVEIPAWIYFNDDPANGERGEFPKHSDPDRRLLLPYPHSLMANLILDSFSIPPQES